MTITKLFNVCTLAVLLGSFSVGAVWADQAKINAAFAAKRASGAEAAFIVDDLDADSVDVVQVFCKGKSRLACADVKDEGPTEFDVSFSVTVVGQTPPGALVGQADNEVSPIEPSPGGTSAPACVVRPTPAAGAMKALVVISQANKVGLEAYSTLIACFDGNDSETLSTFTSKQDQ